MKHIFKSLKVAMVLVVLLSTIGIAAQPAAAGIAIPAATIDSATLHIFSTGNSGGIVRAHRVTAPWDEMMVTWNSFAGSFDPAVEDDFVPGYGWQSVDLTDLVQSWVNGTYFNYGVLLEQDLLGYTLYWSSEAEESPLFPDPWPKLEICYTVAGTSTCVTIQGEENVADTYIAQVYPDLNFGSRDILLTGLINGYEKQSLLWFDFSVIPSGCTLTPGYWKTHSEYGPAPYNDTWAELPDGADTLFFDTGQTWYEVLWTEPKGGNAYYILAHQYIAAYLNELSGAAPSGMLITAESLLDLYDGDPMGMGEITKDVRKDFISTAEALDLYNNGYMIPGHCSE